MDTTTQDKDMIAEVEKAKLLAGQYKDTRDKARLLKAYISVYGLSIGLDMFISGMPDNLLDYQANEYHITL